MNRGRIALVMALALAAPPAADAAYAIRGFVIASGGSPTGSATRRLLGTAGQPVVGTSAGASHILCHGFWCFGGSRVVSVDDQLPPGAALPAVLAMGRAYPNPAPGAIRFALDLPRAAAVDLRVHDVQGRLVRVVASGRLDPGFLTLTWDGRSEAGRRAPAGVYYARLLVDGSLIGRRTLVLRD